MLLRSWEQPFDAIVDHAFHIALNAQRQLQEGMFRHFRVPGRHDLALETIAYVDADRIRRPDRRAR